MANIHDYIAWRGDLSFDKVPLREADALILAQLSYISFGSFVPSTALFPEEISVEEAGQKLLSFDPEGDKIHQTFYLWKENKKMLEELIRAPRFRNVPLFAYEDHLSDDSQFAAICMKIGRNKTVIGFRGTDDSIAGWKEDFYMSLDHPIPSQVMAAEYLEAVSQLVTGEIYLTGHSKGGNLAVYAAAHVSKKVQNRIEKVYNLDGPGFSGPIFQTEGYQQVKDKIRSFLPESSVVGRLLNHEKNYRIVQAHSFGVLQHNPFFWQILGPAFEKADSMSQSSELTHDVLDNWVSSMDEEQRKEFVEAVFSVLETMEVKNFEEVPAALITQLPRIIRRLHLIDKEKKDNMLKMIRSLGETVFQTIKRNILEKDREKLPPSDGENPPKIDKNV